MSPRRPSNPIVASLVASNDGDCGAFSAALASGAMLTVAGNQRSLSDWIDREIFSARGRL